MRALSIAAVEIKRFARDRNNVFSVVLLPMLLVLLIGSLAGESADPRLGVHVDDDSAFSAELIEGLRDVGGMEVFEVGSRDAVIGDVERGRLEAGLIVPNGYEQDLRAGTTVELEFVAEANDQLQGIGRAVQAVVTQQATLIRAAQFAEGVGVGSFDAALATAGRWQNTLPPVEVTVTQAGEPSDVQEFGQFDLAGQTQLVLFMFLTTLGGATVVIEIRRLGVAQRVMATPASVGDLITGVGLSRFAVALIQGAFLMIASWALFQVNWGSLPAALVTLLVFALVSASAAMLLGALARNEDQAGGLATLFGLGLAALGGAMLPLALFKLLSETVYRVAHIAPHAWALEAFEELVVADGGLSDILGFLAILVAYAAVFLAVATWRLRVVLTR